MFITLQFKLEFENNEEKQKVLDLMRIQSLVIEYQEWLIAHKVIDLAKEKGKAIAIESLNKVKKGFRGKE